MKCKPFVDNVAVLRINAPLKLHDAPFHRFAMPSSNLIGFGT